MICLSIGTVGYDKIVSSLSKVSIAEIRLDLTSLNREETINLFKTKRDLIATCRSHSLDIQECQKRITWAIMASRIKKNVGKRYLDIDYNAPTEYRQSLVRLARNYGFTIILSYHNYNSTESFERLCEIYQEALSNGAQIVKIVTNAKTIQEAARLIKLYSVYPAENLVAFSIGDNAKFTRVVAHSLGSPVIYCTEDNNINPTAPGQLTLSEAKNILSKRGYPYLISNRTLQNKVVAPASKSHAQRAILSSALAKGKTILYGYTPCADSESALNLIKSLGCKVKVEKCRIPKFKITIESKGIDQISTYLSKEEIFSKNLKSTTFNVGESGLLCRLAIPLSGLICSKSKKEKKIIIKGEGTLKNREIIGSSHSLDQFGINIHSKSGKLPLTLTGKLHGGDFKLSGKGGSQLMSGLLMTLPLCQDSSTIVVDEPTSTPYIDLTIKSIKEFGVNVSHNDFFEYKILGRQKYKSRPYFAIDGDWSAASMLLVAGVITNGIVISNLPVNSKQADEKIIEILKGCGAEIQITELPKYLVMCGDTPCLLKEDSKEDIVLGSVIEVAKPKKDLLPFEFDATNYPDLFPTLVVLALNCNGTSKIKGIERLSNKESNRAQSLLCEFTKLGAKIEIDGDWMIVHKGNLRGGLCSAHNDHRIAMAIITASLNCKDKIYLDNLNCVSKSYPDFISNFK